MIRIAAFWAAVVLLSAPARGRDPDPTPAEPKDQAAASKEDMELQEGDTVTLLIDKALRTRARRHGIRILFVIASRTLEPYKELDAYVGPSGHLVANTTTFLLPSGTEVVPIPDHTPAVVLEVRPPDGVLNDTTAVRVRPIDGPWKGQEFWVRRSRLVLRTRAAAPPPGPDSILRQARALERLGRPGPSVAFYRRLVAEHPGTAEAAEAAARIAAIGLRAVAATPRPGPSTAGLSP